MAAFTFVLIALAALTCLACTLLLYRGFLRTGTRLLFWSALCFVGLSVNNVLLFFDFVVFPTQVDLRPWRLLAALAGLLFLLYAFIWEAE
jgi:drug/metabolite transporter (DMT)-like permease